MSNQENVKNLEAIKKLLQVSPGSTLLLRGHVDNALVDEFRKQGGEAYVRSQALRAMELSKNRAARFASCWSRSTASTPSASTSSAAAGKSRPDPTRIRIAASRCSGSRSSDVDRGSGLGARGSKSIRRS